MALPFDIAEGSVVVGGPIECPSLQRDRACARPLESVGPTGAVAFSRTGDPATGDFSDAKVIRKLTGALALIAWIGLALLGYLAVPVVNSIVLAVD